MTTTRLTDKATLDLVYAVMTGSASKGSQVRDEFIRLAGRNGYGYRGRRGGWIWHYSEATSDTGRPICQGWQAFAERVWTGAVPFKSAAELGRAAYEARLTELRGRELPQPAYDAAERAADSGHAGDWDRALAWLTDDILADLDRLAEDAARAAAGATHAEAAQAPTADRGEPAGRVANVDLARVLAYRDDARRAEAADGAQVDPDTAEFGPVEDGDGCAYGVSADEYGDCDGDEHRYVVLRDGVVPMPDRNRAGIAYHAGEEATVCASHARAAGRRGHLRRAPSAAATDGVEVYNLRITVQGDAVVIANTDPVGVDGRVHPRAYDAHALGVVIDALTAARFRLFDGGRVPLCLRVDGVHVGHMAAVDGGCRAAAHLDEDAAFAPDETCGCHTPARPVSAHARPAEAHPDEDAAVAAHFADRTDSEMTLTEIQARSRDEAGRGCTAERFATGHPYEFDQAAADTANTVGDYEMCGRPADDPIHVGDEWTRPVWLDDTDA